MGQQQLFCRGFSAWNDQELAEHFHWFGNTRPGVEREELEALADRWQLADQTSRRLRVPCDIGESAPVLRCGCQGWERFDDRQLHQLLEELERDEAEGQPPRHAP